MTAPLLNTLKGSLLEDFFPAGWDLGRIHACCSNPPAALGERQPHWHSEFQLTACDSLSDFDVRMGHEIAFRILRAKESGRKLALILPVGPTSMYRWTVYFLREWDIPCDHVHGFSMDEWSDADGNTPAADHPDTFQFAMTRAFYGPLGSLTVPPDQRHFATRAVLPSYAERIGELKACGAELVVVFGIGRVCHIAFWEPHFAAEFPSEEEWRRQTHRLGARLHPLTVEQNAISKFKGCTTLVSTRANTIGPGLFLAADRIIGGAALEWQAMSLWMTLRYGADPWVPSSYMPGFPGRLFFLKDLAGPLAASIQT